VVLVSHASESSDADVGLCDSPLLAYFSEKRLRAAQAMPAGVPGKAGCAIGVRGESGSYVEPAVKPHSPLWELQGACGLSASQRQVMLPEHLWAGPCDPRTDSHRTPIQSTGGRHARVARASYQASRWQEGFGRSFPGRNPLFELQSLCPRTVVVLLLQASAGVDERA